MPNTYGQFLHPAGQQGSSLEQQARRWKKRSIHEEEVIMIQQQWNGLQWCFTTCWCKGLYVHKWIYTLKAFFFIVAGLTVKLYWEKRSVCQRPPQYSFTKTSNQTTWPNRLPWTISRFFYYFHRAWPPLTEICLQISLNSWLAKANKLIINNIPTLETTGYDIV